MSAGTASSNAATATRPQHLAAIVATTGEGGLVTQIRRSSRFNHFRWFSEEPFPQSALYKSQFSKFEVKFPPIH